MELKYEKKIKMSWPSGRTGRPISILSNFTRQMDKIESKSRSTNTLELN